MTVRVRFLAIMAAAVFLLGVLIAPLVSAEDVQVTAGVGDTTIRITGWTAPHAFVTFRENFAVIGTATADASGHYTLLLASQSPGIHNFSVSSRDSAGRVTDDIEVQVSASEHTETAVEIFLPPAFTVEEQPGKVILDGSTAAGATVVIMLGDYYFTATAGPDGNWHAELSPDQLPPGIYSLRCVALLPGGQQSYFSEPRTITMSAVPGASTPDNGPLPLHPGTLWLGLPKLPPHGRPSPGVSVPVLPGRVGPGDFSRERALRGGYDILEPVLIVALAVSFVTVGVGWLVGIRRRGVGP